MLISIPAGASVQAAIDAAQAGDVLVLEAGATYPAPVLTEKAGTVTIRGNQPLPDRRLIQSDVGLLPVFQSQSVEPSLICDGAKYWRIDGVRIGPTKDGMYNAVRCQGSTSMDFDRLYFEGGTQGQRRVIMANGRDISVTRSHLGNVWREGEESQAICAWDGAGPYLIRDNFLEAAAMPFLFGGAPSSRPEEIPSDILIEGNTCTKRVEWKGKPYKVKNLGEIKSGKRVVIRQNLFQHNWTDGQDGYAILFTVNDDSGPWGCVEDVIFEENEVLDSELGVNVLGKSYSGPSGQATRITVRQNRFRLFGSRFGKLGGEIGHLAFLNNTIEMDPSGQLLMLYLGDIFQPESQTSRPARYAVEGFAWQGNVSPASAVFGDGLGDAVQDGIPVAIRKYVQVYNGQPMADPIVDPPPPPPPPPPPAPDPLADLKQAVSETTTKLASTQAKLTAVQTYLSQAPDTKDAKALARYLRAVPK
jgi:hypothetical protein